MRKLVLVIIVLVLAAVGTAGFFYQRTRQPYRGFITGSEQFVEIPAGSSTRTIGDLLVAAGVVRDRVTFRFALWLSGRARLLKAGEYRFDQPMTPADVIGKIARGDVYVVRVTFREGLTIGEMAGIFERHGFGTAAEFIAAARDATAVRALDPAARNLEGYLFPETYSVPRRIDAASLVQRMVDQFKHAFSSELQAAATARGMSVREVVTLASIVEKETARPEERPLVAAVYENRLRIGMALQCDPTVIYALMERGKYNGNLRREDLALDSPYNTYRYPGLPPGPIAAPGKASLESAVHPAGVEFLYFVSRNDGSHEFAQTLDEHNRNVRKYQVEYFRERRSEAAGGAGKTGGPSRTASGAGFRRSSASGRGTRYRSPHFNFSLSTSK